jgi:hypothetical protein
MRCLVINFIIKQNTHAFVVGGAKFITNYGSDCVLLSTVTKLNMFQTEYLDKVAAVINRTSPQCLNDLTEGFNCLENAVHGKPCGVFNQSRSEIVDMFK